jgi:hypothetical protein
MVIQSLRLTIILAADPMAHPKIASVREVAGTPGCRPLRSRVVRSRIRPKRVPPGGRQCHARLVRSLLNFGCGCPALGALPSQLAVRDYPPVPTTLSINAPAAKAGARKCRRPYRYRPKQAQELGHVVVPSAGLSA